LTEGGTPHSSHYLLVKLGEHWVRCVIHGVLDCVRALTARLAIAVAVNVGLGQVKHIDSFCGMEGRGRYQKEACVLYRPMLAWNNSKSALTCSFITGGRRRYQKEARVVNKPFPE
jgi:hypothetical protein